MLKLTMDVYSGRENPTCLVDDENEVRALLKAMADNRAELSDKISDNTQLGFRGFQVELMHDGLANDYGFGSSIFVPSLEATGADLASDVTDRLFRAMEIWLSKHRDSLDVSEQMEIGLRQLAIASRGEGGRVSLTDELGDTPSAESQDVSVRESRGLVSCTIELESYNPGFWNNNPTILSRNNCYNYASNKRTDTFAQPGRGCGRQYTATTCTDVANAAMCDGLHKRYNCFPNTEIPRYLVALVVAPGPVFKDFHWYRKNSQGFWSHKPGSTAVRNTDNSGKIIMNPETCNRGSYTNFCGYFYTCKSQKIR
ncbi:hypothetical protein SIID45300_00082 [Candidatus Magnetaquicoccaceae bacterium FCR-1]|uniref:Uncharacterized protein n=1 Tax=Candidatus Magnetaquiglobus chichijimensis TaxID=3141448 RepID=A0ABQ0C4G8_9PROT